MVPGNSVLHLCYIGSDIVGDWISIHLAPIYTHMNSVLHARLWPFLNIFWLDKQHLDDMLRSQFWHLVIPFFGYIKCIGKIYCTNAYRVPLSSLFSWYMGESSMISLPLHMTTWECFNHVKLASTLKYRVCTIVICQSG